VKKRPSFFKIEQYLAGELNAAEVREFEIQLETDPGLKRYVQLQKGLRYDASTTIVQTQLRPAMGGFVLSKAWKRIGERLSPVFPPQVAWAMGLCLLAGAVLVLFRPESLSVDSSESDFTAKGASVPFFLTVGGNDIQPDQSGTASAGDTMNFVYRSLAGLHVQIWYQDDGGALQSYLAPSNSSSSWKAASAWREANQKVVLSSDWNKESVWIVWSDHGFTSQEAKKALEGGRADGIQKTVFHFTRSR
jgi:hypothetical protein